MYLWSFVSLSGAGWCRMTSLTSLIVVLQCVSWDNEVSWLSDSVHRISWARPIHMMTLAGVSKPSMKIDFKSHWLKYLWVSPKKLWVGPYKIRDIRTSEKIEDHYFINLPHIKKCEFNVGKILGNLELKNRSTNSRSWCLGMIELPLRVRFLWITPSVFSYPPIWLEVPSFPIPSYSFPWKERAPLE